MSLTSTNVVSESADDVTQITGAAARLSAAQAYLLGGRNRTAGIARSSRVAGVAGPFSNVSTRNRNGFASSPTRVVSVDYGADEWGPVAAV